MNRGISIPTGQPSTQPGLAQSKQRCASRCAISAVSPWLTSSFNLRARYCGSSSGIWQRSMARRSLGFMLLLSSLRQAASRLLSSSSATAMHSQSAESQGSFSAFPLHSPWFVHSGTSSNSGCFFTSSSAATSSGLKAAIRFSISSKSTWCPSNSGPSTQTNFVCPPTVIRQAPHIPVPSTMMVFSETSVGISYFFVSKQTNFIMIAGPMAKHLSTFSR